MSWRASWQRRFSSSSAHEELLSTPKVRIRTWSDSVAETATPEEIADHESELIQQRRNSNISSSGGGHVTNFLASQTLGLCFLAVPGSAGEAAAIKHDLKDPSSSGPTENVASIQDVEERRQQQRLHHRRCSENLNQLVVPSSQVQRRFSSGAKLNEEMASAARRHKTSTLSLFSSAVRNERIAASTSKLDETTGIRSSMDEPITVTPPSPHSSLTASKKSSVASTTNNESYSLSKKFSQSTPALPQLHYDLANNLGRSKTRQKKFLRLFPSVGRDERVLNHYSCALVGDILLQGRLYITYNCVAFHSNVFGYVTKLLIPMGDIKKISKEKTARIIPNAIGFTTAEGKKIFGSLMARDVVYRLVHSVWKKYHFPNGAGDFIDSIDGEKENEGSSQNGEHSSNESYSQHSADGLIMSLPRPTVDSAHVTSATEGCTSSDMDENDSAIERSYSPTPEREKEVTSSKVTSIIRPGLSTLNLLTSAVQSGSTFLNFWSSTTTSSGNRDVCDGQDRPDGSYRSNSSEEAANDPEECDDHQYQPASQTQDHLSNHLGWPLKGISLLLVVLCLSAGFLWYRMYLLHSHLELRLLAEETGRNMGSSAKSLYSPQMQELVDNLHFLLSSRTSDEQRSASK